MASESECWIWTAGLSHNGYGKLSVKNRDLRAHRFAYELLVGPIPLGLTLDHLCRNRACVNPAHLEPVTIRENLMRGESFSAVNARKTHCKRGHEFNVENTGRDRKGRYCRSCAREAMRRYRSIRQLTSEAA